MTHDSMSRSSAPNRRFGAFAVLWGGAILLCGSAILFYFLDWHQPPRVYAALFLAGLTTVQVVGSVSLVVGLHYLIKG
jgi:hypothetical protein